MLIVIIMSVILFLLIVLVFSLFLLSRVNAKEIERNQEKIGILARHKHLKTKPMHAWYDPDFEATYGSSLYEMEDGSKKFVTTVADRRDYMCGRWSRSAFYIGQAKRFISRGRIGATSYEESFAYDGFLFESFLIDVAVLCFLDNLFWSERYPVDVIHPDFDPPEASIEMQADLSMSAEEMFIENSGVLEGAELPSVELPSVEIDRMKTDAIDNVIHHFNATTVEAEPIETVETEPSSKSSYNEPVVSEPSYDSGGYDGGGDSGGGSD